MCLTENWIERGFLLLGDFAGRYPLFWYGISKYFIQNIDLLFEFSQLFKSVLKTCDCFHEKLKFDG